MAASELYEQKCVLCHGETGRGEGPVAQSLPQSPADFTDTRKMKEVTDGELFWKMSTGRGSMPSWQDSLSETERWQLVSYLCVLATFGLYRYLGRPSPDR
jgi:mono/diheme cytochrome c family protein